MLSHCITYKVKWYNWACVFFLAEAIIIDFWKLYNDFILIKWSYGRCLLSTFHLVWLHKTLPEFCIEKKFLETVCVSLFKCIWSWFILHSFIYLKDHLDGESPHDSINVVRKRRWQLHWVKWVHFGQSLWSWLVWL